MALGSSGGSVVCRGQLMRGVSFGLREAMELNWLRGGSMVGGLFDALLWVDVGGREVAGDVEPCSERRAELLVVCLLRVVAAVVG